MRAVCFVVLFLVAWLAGAGVEAKPRYTAANTDQQQQQAAPPQTFETSSTTHQAAGEGDGLRESDVAVMLDAEQRKHERRLKELQTRLQRELQHLQEHFDSIMVKLKKTEEQLEANLKNVEVSVTKKMASSQEKLHSSTSSWRWPFIVLVLLLVGLGAYFGRLYHKATKGIRNF
ncbi:hypothetical protein BASA81_010612 [Batrachochytrium salamandrivorans]|nr:hypothetical protein BASA81_010612 [Batrachochytrium salamandrivorans]